MDRSRFFSKKKISLAFRNRYYSTEQNCHLVTLKRLGKMSTGLSLYKDGMTATQVAATERPSFARNKGAYSGDALAIYTAGSETVLLKHGGGNYKFPNTFFQYQGDWLRGRMHGTCCCTISSGSKKIMIMRTPSPFTWQVTGH